MTRRLADARKIVAVAITRFFNQAATAPARSDVRDGVRPARSLRGGPDGNEQLTAMTGVILLVLLAALARVFGCTASEGATQLRTWLRSRRTRRCGSCARPAGRCPSTANCGPRTR